ncbi:MAG TPA: hypothetical protein VF196_03345, partial [Casimicrobiaceae bacterium]
MAVTIGVSFLLVIPIEFLIVPTALFGGMMIGYYANARADRRGGPWGRVIANALFAGLVTGLSLAVLYLAVKGLFFMADDGYRDASAGGRLTCETGPDCVYQRYLAFHGAEVLEAQGVSDVDTFTQFYWTQQLSQAGSFLALSLGGSLIGGLMYGATNRRKPEEGETAA